MKIKELKEQLKNIPDDTEVFIRCAVNPCGNIIEAGSADKSTYGFFGKDIDCIIIEPMSTEDEE
jgi:hypothetical protein